MANRIIVSRHLAALAESVTAIEFAGKPPRGTEYTMDDLTIELRQARLRESGE